MPLASEKFAVVEIIKGLVLNFFCAILYINVSFQGLEMKKKLLLSFLPTWQSIGKLYLFKQSRNVRHVTHYVESPIFVQRIDFDQITR